MQTSVIGYPRIGTLRELKFALEKYFKNISEMKSQLQSFRQQQKSFVRYTGSRRRRLG